MLFLRDCTVLEGALCRDAGEHDAAKHDNTNRFNLRETMLLSCATHSGAPYLSASKHNYYYHYYHYQHYHYYHNYDCCLRTFLYTKCLHASITVP